MKHTPEKSFQLRTRYLDMPTGLALAYNEHVSIHLLLRLSKVCDDLDFVKEVILRKAMNSSTSSL